MLVPVPGVKLHCILLQRSRVSHFGLPILPRSFQLDEFRAAAALDLPTLKGALDDPLVGIHVGYSLFPIEMMVQLAEHLQLLWPRLQRRIELVKVCAFLLHVADRRQDDVRRFGLDFGVCFMVMLDEGV
ncbi:hypothetical protein BDZ89DRAFT_793046 [Hymenopellis radicata]|nr:hypothetical protein BDZ89DRAFT_793046 [Hymenopellis radicata]